MATGTIVGKYTSLDYVSDNIFESQWFCLLWAIGTATGIVYSLKREIRQLVVVALHLSFVVILLGALLTHLTSNRGMVRLRQGETIDACIARDGDEARLPFSIRLNKFTVSYHVGNMTTMDYASIVTLIQGDKHGQYQISVNNIYSGYGTRLYQSSYGEDMRGSYLSINSDSYEIPVTYLGYTLLFFGLIAMLIDPKGNFRRLLRREVIAGIMLVMGCLNASIQPTLPRQSVDEFEKILIIYNGRICPMETYAIDSTTKLYGKKSCKDFTPSQVLTGLMFWEQEWMKEPILRLKRTELRDKLSLNEYISPVSLFRQQGYILGPYPQDTHSQENNNVSKQSLDTDDKMILLMGLTQGKPLRIFPYIFKSNTVDWFAPTDRCPKDMPKEQQQCIRSIPPLAGQFTKQGKIDMPNELILKLRRYQYRYGGNAIPSDTVIKAEGIYNHFSLATILFIFNLAAGLPSVLFPAHKKRYRLFIWLMSLSRCILIFTLALRWVVGGTIPLANGYETMLLLSWLIMLVSVLTTRELQLMITFGLLMGGLMLLISYLSETDPSITLCMPVLNSPLLSIRVGIIMVSYALLSPTFISAMAYFLTCSSKREGVMAANRQLTVLSQIFLYPAITTLELGMFIGAIWTNTSWRSYWKWDPKETWVLVTSMIYTIPLHTNSFSTLGKPKNYHLFMLLSFSSIPMIYFGINYILNGMHSYA